MERDHCECLLLQESPKLMEQRSIREANHGIIDEKKAEEIDEKKADGTLVPMIRYDETQRFECISNPERCDETQCSERVSNPEVPPTERCLHGNNSTKPSDMMRYNIDPPVNNNGAMCNGAITEKKEQEC
uniref:Uncharacterized protein n=1 Tax=Acrobeloides nanus TaxID=290746 RepID=A0A914CL98_9BILA